MKSFWQKYKKKSLRLAYPIVGAVALIWFLIRVIPKPSRAGYPCMKAAFPLASSFIAMLSGLAIWKGMSRFIHNPRGRRFSAAALMSLGLLAGIATVSSLAKGDKTLPVEETLSDYTPNAPMGEASGMFPGRVVWVHNPDATNENAAWKDFPREANGDAWFLDHNNNQAVIADMLSTALQTYSETENNSEAWDRIFKAHNQEQGKGAIGYQEGEIIFIKVNMVSGWNIDRNRDIRINGSYGITETSPHLILALLHHLVDEAGVPQENIYVGDPMRAIYNHVFDKWVAEFPNIHYLDAFASSNGREKVQFSEEQLIKYSDRGAVLRTGSWEDATAGSPVYGDRLATIFEDCDYLLNIPAMKAHQRAGVTLFAKNHFGSHSRDSALHMHAGLVNMGYRMRNHYGEYRIQTDLMGHRLLGKKNLFYILDALWASDYEIDQPDRFQSAPFNDDWTSSIIVSGDPVAIESVGFDILRNEFSSERYGNNTSDNTGKTIYPNYGAVDDYLHQAADKANWPEGIVYDPEEDGTPIESLGVHEHWNNAEERLYSRNLDSGEGIELLYVKQ